MDVRMENKIDMNSVISGNLKLTDFIYNKKEYYGVHIITKSKKLNKMDTIKSWYESGVKCKPEITQLTNLLKEDDEILKLGAIRTNTTRDGFVYDCMRNLMTAAFHENSIFSGYNISDYLSNFEKSLELTFLYLVNAKLIESDVYILAETDDEDNISQFYFVINFLSDRDVGIVLIDLE